MKIVVAVARLDEGQRRRLTNALAPEEVVFADSSIAETARELAVKDAEVVFGNVSARWLSAAPRLRWVQLDSAGVDAYLQVNEQRRERPIAFTHLRNFYDRAVGEAALAGMLAFYRQFPRFFAAQRERRWVKPTVEPMIGQLHGARVIILGAGTVASRLGKLLGAFECDVRLYARHAPAAQLHGLVELDRALASVDAIVNTLPHTPETNQLLDRARLARLGPTSLVVNMGRGSALDEAALLDALDGDRLAGAVLDVTSIEPLPPESPLWSHPRVILTQHTGGRFPGETAAKVDRFLANYERFKRREPLLDLMDAARGY